MIFSWLVITIVSTRFLPIAVFGKYILYNISITLLTTLSQSFITNTLLRLYPQYKQTNKLDDFVSNMFYYLLISTTVTIILILLAYCLVPNLLNKILPFNIIYLIIPLIILNIYNFFLSIYRATGNVILYGFFNFWQMIGSFGIGFLVYTYNNQEATDFYLGFIGALLLFAPFIYFQFKLIINKLFDYKLSDHFKHDLLSYGFPIFIIGTSSLLLSNLDKYFIIYLLDINKVSLYSAIYTISEQSILPITGLLSITSIPYLFNQFEKSGADHAKVFQEKILKFYLFLSLPALIILCIFSNEILSLVLTNKYQKAFILLPYISVGAFFIGLSNVFSEAFTLRKKTSTLMYLYLASIIFNAILNYLLINKFGILGAAIATFSSYALLFILIFNFSRKLIKFNLLREEIFALLISVILLASFCFIIKNTISIESIFNLIFYIITSLLIYFSSIAAFKYYDYQMVYISISKIYKKIIIT
ncbi:MAG: lipopolysaccharide biosynthesis protein [Lutibacter sp.]|nr:lipopolysaccharide biosynthesis protein [Lutibacter sp.]